jgi:hypothetical protein
MPLLLQQTIEFDELPGLEIRIAVRHASGRLAIAIEPLFRESQSIPWRDLGDLRTLDRLELDIPKFLAEARKKLEPAERSLRYWQGRERELKAKEPSRSSRGYSAWQRKSSEASSKRASYQSDVDRQGRAVSLSQALYDMLPSLRAFIKISHQQARIHFVVYTNCGDQDLLLIDATGQR